MNNKLSKISSLVLISSSVLLFDAYYNPNQAEAAALRPGFTGNTLPRNDDLSTGLVNIGFTANFFGVSRTQVYVNNNGNVTFDQALSTYTPFDLNSTSRQIIAPFFADVDTRNPASSEVTYGQGSVDGRNAFGVNWNGAGVGFFNNRANPLNKFQLVMIDRSDVGAGDFDFEFNYDQILWESGEASGSNERGLGGSSARVGYANGTGAPGTFFELPGSAVNGAFLDNGPADTRLIGNSRNSDLDGRYVFEVRNGQVQPPAPEPEPEPPAPGTGQNTSPIGNSN
ncbi:MAG: VPLPA-CTERM sorting domain-containing protein, partial [Gloeocapsa sp. DLM2.Bin57]